MAAPHRVAVGLLTLATLAAQRQPFESDVAIAPCRIDALVTAQLAELGIPAARPCADAIFIRRVFLDTLGILPTADEARRFLAEKAPDKRARLVDAVLARPEFVDFQTMRWCDVLRVKAEFPINLWPNAVQAWQRWLRDSRRTAMPWDQFARTVLLAAGSNFRDPEVNFLRGTPDRSPAGIARIVALTFLGERIETWPAAQQIGLATCFGSLRWKATQEWKEEVLVGGLAETPFTVVLPDGSQATVEPGQDPRTAFVDWLFRDQERRLAQALCNRIWAWLCGRGIVHEPDDRRPDNPPSVPGLLEHLADRLLVAGYDQRAVYRAILLSATYQRSSLPNCEEPRAAACFAHASLRRLEAEVLIDAIDAITGTNEEYVSPAPEPFTRLPVGTRAVTIADGSTTSAFLELFGRPPRDTGLHAERSDRISARQCLHLLNSSQVRKKLEGGPALARTLRAKDAIGELWLTFLSRPPTDHERQLAEQHIAAAGPRATPALQDLAWALLNSAEFLFRH